MIDRNFQPQLLRNYRQPANRTLDVYLTQNGYAGARKALSSAPADVINLVKSANIRGRGGAGFAAGLKWSFVPPSPKPKYLVCNADESEPGTYKDRAIITFSPHLLIEGMIIAAYAVNCRNAYVFIRGEYVVEAQILENAVAEAYEKGYLGKNIMGSKFSLDLNVHRGAGAYICGEETGLLSALEGDRGYPKIKPPFPAVEGAFRSPTVVNNVETLCNVSLLYQNSVDWYKALGPAASPGPKVFCLSGHVKRPGLYEHPMNITLRELIYDEKFGGGILGDKRLKAVIPGGSSMPVFKFDGKYKDWSGKEKEDSLDVQMEFDSIKNAGSLLGSAGVIVMTEEVCMVNALYNLIRFYHHESCGQCTPCRVGCGWLEKILHRIHAGEGRPEDINLLMDLAQQMSGTTICLLADSAAMPVGAFIMRFREEFEYYCREHRSKYGGQSIHAWSAGSSQVSAAVGASR
ncbi:MAG: NADH-quinone oxidoreductase subunit NuoF [Planctomycetota bacterium]